jgi:hypothetical protein
MGMTATARPIDGTLRHEIDVHDGLRVDVEYDPEPTPRQVRLVVHAPAGLPAEQTERLRRIANTCPAKRALEAGFTFDEGIVVGGDPPGGVEVPPVNTAAA